MENKKPTPKVTKNDLVKAMDALSYAINESYGAVGTKELHYAKLRLQHPGVKLITLIDGNLNSHARKLVPEASELIEKMDRRIEAIKKVTDADLGAVVITEPAAALDDRYETASARMH